MALHQVAGSCSALVFALNFFSACHGGDSSAPPAGTNGSAAMAQDAEVLGDGGCPWGCDPEPYGNAESCNQLMRAPGRYSAACACYADSGAREAACDPMLGVAIGANDAGVVYRGGNWCCR